MQTTHLNKILRKFKDDVAKANVKVALDWTWSLVQSSSFDLQNMNHQLENSMKSYQKNETDGLEWELG